MPLQQGDDLVHTARMEMIDIVRSIKCVVGLQGRMFCHALVVEGEGETDTFHEAARGFSVAM